MRSEWAAFPSTLWNRFLLSLRLIAAVRSAGRPLFYGLWIVNLTRTVLPTISGLVGGLLVSRLITAPGDQRELTWLVVAGCGLIFASQAVDVLSTPLAFSASRRVDGWHRRSLTTLVGRPEGISHLEDESIRDDLQAALLKGLPGWASYTFGTGAVGQITVTSRTVGACFAALILARFSWVLAVLLLVVTLMVRTGIRKEWLAQHAVVRELAPATRRANYWADVVAQPWAAKELRVFGLADWAIAHFRELMERRVARLATVRAGVLRRMTWMFLPLAAAVIVGLGVLADAAATGRISAGSLAIYLGAFWGVVTANGMDVESFDVHFAGLPTLHALDRLEVTVNGSAPAATPTPTPTPTPTGELDRPLIPSAPPLVRFEAVGFHYPRSDRPVLAGLDLDIRPAEMLALVGVNGAGKTTLTKLLTGMYEPTAGRITVNGLPLADIGLPAWRRQIAVVQQRFVHYDLSLRENVVLGAPGPRPDPGLLESVAQQAGIDDLVRRAPSGWDTPLSRAYQGGTDLSGGQWQRVALARALYAVARGARLLVLDEPTAHLDIRAELDVFSRVTAGAHGVGIMLISHRLSTVRRADRIVLIEGGTAVEAGHHDDLVARGGRYAEMFALQADRFDDSFLENSAGGS